jgi:3-oxoacyl-[acyl-carrier protein] reductase
MQYADVTDRDSNVEVPVHSLDGKGQLPPLAPPATANPNILPAGL